MNHKFAATAGLCFQFTNGKLMVQVTATTSTHDYYYSYYYYTPPMTTSSRRHTCDLKQVFAAMGSKRLPRELGKRLLFDASNSPHGEIGSMCLPEVQIGSNGLARVQSSVLVVFTDSEESRQKLSPVFATNDFHDAGIVEVPVCPASEIRCSWGVNS